MPLDLIAALAAQGLDLSDLAENRAGRVSDRQIALQQEVRRAGARGVWIMAAVVFIISVLLGVWNRGRTGSTSLFIFMSLFGLVVAALPVVIYYVTRFADPAKVAASPVTLLAAAEVGVLLPTSNRGVYAVSLNQQSYSGFASEISASLFRPRVNAYVVAEHRIVVALEPLG